MSLLLLLRGWQSPSARQPWKSLFLTQTLVSLIRIYAKDSTGLWGAVPVSKHIANRQQAGATCSKRQATQLTEALLVLLQFEGPVQVARRSDMDMNGHINNVTYLAWALETVPIEIYLTYSLIQASTLSQHPTPSVSTAVIVMCQRPCIVALSLMDRARMNWQESRECSRGETDIFK